jgi:hypothetical protein
MKGFYMTPSINGTQNNWTLSITMLCIMLSVIMQMSHFIYCYAGIIILNVVMLSIIMLSVVMLNVVMLSVNMLNAVMLRVGAP